MSVIIKWKRASVSGLPGTVVRELTLYFIRELVLVLRLLAFCPYVHSASNSPLALWFLLVRVDADGAEVKEAASLLQLLHLLVGLPAPSLELLAVVHLPGFQVLNRAFVPLNRQTRLAVLRLHLWRFFFSLGGSD